MTFLCVPDLLAAIYIHPLQQSQPYRKHNMVQNIFFLYKTYRIKQGATQDHVIRSVSSLMRPITSS